MTYEYVNPFFTRMFGYSVANIIDRNTWYEKAYPDPVYRERVKTAWRADFAEHDGFWRMQAETFTVRCKDGTDKMIRVNGVVLPDNRVLMTHEDVTQLVNAQRALQVAKDVAEAATETKSKFLANMSHEIRTPMNAILGFADILSGQIENSTHKEFLDAITASGKTLLSLINDILDLSKIEAGKLRLEYSAVNPRTIFRDIQQVFTLETKRKGISFQVEIDPELPAALILDEVRLRQILLNLAGNAVKFTNSGGITLSATKRYRHPDHSALEFVFSVQDTGVGIPLDQQEKIFEVFHQQAGTARRVAAGNFPLPQAAGQRGCFFAVGFEE